MKRAILSIFAAFSIAGNAQVTVMDDSFETYQDFTITGFGDWLNLDLDGLDTYVGGTLDDADWPNAGDPQAFIIFNPLLALTVNSVQIGDEGENANFTPRTGLKYAACWNSVPEMGQGNDDWLVSPPIDLTNATGSALSVWVKSLSDTYGLEKYRIGVYTGAGAPTSSADFTIISGATDLSPQWATWQERTQSLSAYDGQIIRVGIQCKSLDNYMFMVDDFRITAATLSLNDNLTSGFSMTPNPTSELVQLNSATNVNINEITITDLNGRVMISSVTGGGNVHQLDVSALSSGMYLVNIDSDKGMVSQKLVKR